jgi:hypothetical protein
VSGYREKYPRNLAALANELNSEAQVAATRFEMALDCLELWLAEHPDSRHLVVMTRGLLERCERGVPASPSEDTGTTPGGPT